MKTLSQETTEALAKSPADYVREERVRLRPLLADVLAEMEHIQRKYSDYRPKILNDLRRELGKE